MVLSSVSRGQEVVLDCDDYGSMTVDFPGKAPPKFTALAPAHSTDIHG
jgi:hypothetical protein